jgi:hypothetical protein
LVKGQGSSELILDYGSQRAIRSRCIGTIRALTQCKSIYLGLRMTYSGGGRAEQSCIKVNSKKHKIYYIRIVTIVKEGGARGYIALN